MDEQELQSEETWDLANAERHEPAKNRRSIVSVAFRPEQFAEVSRLARNAGMKLSEYIRSRSLGDSIEDGAELDITCGPGSATFIAKNFAPTTTKTPPKWAELAA